MIYLLVFVFLFFLVYHYDIKENKVNKAFVYRLVLLILILISGFRYRIGGDTVSYLHSFYHEIPYIWDISFDSVDSLPSEPLFFLMNSLVKSCGGKFYIVQLIHAIFVNGLIFVYIRRHSDYIFTCVFFYYIWMYAMYNFEEMRASMSIAVCLFANDFLLERKWLKGMLLYFVGILFHYSTVVLLLTPLFLFLKLNFMGYAFLVSAFFVGFIIQNSFGDYLILFEFSDYASEKASTYVNSDVYFEQTKTIRGIVASVLQYILYSLGAVAFLKRKGANPGMRDFSLIKLQPFLIMGLVFVIFSIPMPISYRFIRFYTIYFILYSSYLFIGLAKLTPQVSSSITLIRSVVLFVPLFNLISHIYRDPIHESSKMQEYYCYEKYYPYSSVFGKSTYYRRERLYRKLGSIKGIINPKEDEF